MLNYHNPLILMGIVTGGFILDSLLGDPYWMPHPIIFIGKWISILEKWIRKGISNNRLGGCCLVVGVLMVTCLLPYGLLWLISQFSQVTAILIETFFCFQILAMKSLEKESMKVYQPLVDGDIAHARVKLSYIVGRDTDSLDYKGVVKGAVETVAENTTDGIVAPLIFLLIGGAPLGFLYKGINTMDSMVGYKNEEYMEFGTCAAKLDDWANYIPARLSAFFMVLAAGLLKFDWRQDWSIFLRDRYNHKSPNSAQTESVCSGALGIQLGGDGIYFGEKVSKPTIGDDLRPAEARDIIRANQLMVVTSHVCLLFGVMLRGLLWLVL